MNEIRVSVRETAGVERIREPVSFGIPFPKGEIAEKTLLRVTGEKGGNLPFDCKVLRRWEDGSFNWVLFDTQLTLGPGASLTLIIGIGQGKRLTGKGMGVLEKGNDLIVNTGESQFCVSLATCAIKNLESKESLFQNKLSQMVCLKTIDGDHANPVVAKWCTEHDTSMKRVIGFHGRFETVSGPLPLAFSLRYHFFFEKSFVMMDFSFLNPKPAVHKGGAWDLGDPNSFYFRDLSLRFNWEGQERGTHWIDCSNGSPITSESEDVIVSQFSSGGTHWHSPVHMNGEKEIPLQHHGYRVYRNGIETTSGLRATPILGVQLTSGWMTCFCEHFWQNFPKSLSFSNEGLEIGLFPEGVLSDDFELQPGEQKTHRVYLLFNENHPLDSEWVKTPLVCTADTKSYRKGMTCPRPFAGAVEIYDKLLENALNGPDSFRNKNERIDEFGWRNFGDVWADHESHNQAGTLVSHYNNQYDLIKGFVLSFMRSGNHEWFALARELADHVTDIDIYHADRDKEQYNGGMFWHTDHYLPASTSSHRTISIEHKSLKPPGSFGGGPAPDHNYATGLLMVYWLTGDTRYKAAVCGLADNIIQCMTAPHTLMETAFVKSRDFIRKLKDPGYAIDKSSRDIYGFNGPSRASGNGLNTLVDAFLLTDDRKYLYYAQCLIAKCASPEDDFMEMNLLNAEKRWMYTIFVAALGRYLDVKRQSADEDAWYCYSKKILLVYAEWMAQNEFPYLDYPEKLEYPTETWAAQEMRKADIFSYAATYTQGAVKEIFTERAHFFFNEALTRLSAFETRSFTRPVAVIMSCGMPYLERVHSGWKHVDRLESAGHAGPLAVPPNKGQEGHLWKNIKRLSVRKELRWITVQLRSR